MLQIHIKKNQEVEKTDALTTSKTENRSNSPLDSQDTQIATVMADKKAYLFILIKILIQNPNRSLIYSDSSKDSSAQFNYLRRTVREKKPPTG